MTSFVLLDANLLIGAFDTDRDNPKHIEARQILKDLASDSEVVFAITPLIRYEVLRGVKTKSFEEMQEILNDFEEFEITDIEGNRAAQLYYHASRDNIPMNKRNFDVFHYVVAELRDLQWKSLDGDFLAIQAIAQQYPLTQ